MLLLIVFALLSNVNWTDTFQYLRRYSLALTKKPWLFYCYHALVRQKILCLTKGRHIFPFGQKTLEATLIASQPSDLASRVAPLHISSKAKKKMYEKVVCH